MTGIHCFASGRVQGVSYRWFVKERAASLGINGWVRNLRDGRVELKAFGDEVSLNTLIKALNAGPPMSKVSSVSVEPCEFEDTPSFDIAPSA